MPGREDDILRASGVGSGGLDKAIGVYTGPPVEHPSLTR